MSEIYDSVKDFIDYIIGDEENEQYDENLPFGGIHPNAPEKAKKAYSGYISQIEEYKKKGIKV